MSDSNITQEIARHKHTEHADLNDQVLSGKINTQAYQGNSTLFIPGYDVPANQIWRPPSDPSYASDPSYVSDPAYSNSRFVPDRPDQEIIPTLQINQPANQNDQTTYAITDPTAQLTDKQRDSVVQIYGHDHGQAEDEDLTGSGFFIDRHGDLATAYHVVAGIDGPITVQTSDDATHQAFVRAVDPKSDTAILSIDSNSATQPVSLNTDLNALKDGDPLLAMGHPEGWTDLYISPGKYSDQTKLGDISSGKDLGEGNPEQTMIAAKMNTQKGNSGSPTFSAAGQVVGFVDRGDNGSEAYLVPSSAIVALATGKPNPDAQAFNADTAFDNPTRYNLNPSFTQPSDTGPYGLGMAVTAGSTLFNDSFKLKGVLGTAGMFFSAYTGGSDLIHHDGKALYNAFEMGGSDSAKVHSSLSVAADGLLVGSALASFIPSYRAASVGVSLLGSALKIGNRVIRS